MRRNKFFLKPANDYIWNQHEFVDFLIANQNQCITIDTSEEGVDLSSAGVYELLEQFDYQDVEIVTNNLIESHPNYQIKHRNPFKFFNVSQVDYSKYHQWSKKKIFACLFNRPLWHRIGLAAEMQCNHKDQSIINMRSDPNSIDQRSLFELQKLFEYAPDSIVKFAQVKHSWPCRIESIDTYTVGNTTTGHTDQLAYFYLDFLIDIVAETWTQGSCFFPTEKTTRPMLLKKPMIVMGPKNYLEHLRQMGFRTFADFWDEDYDGYDNQDRYLKILALIDKLSSMSVTELEIMYWDMQYTLDHNYDLIIQQDYTQKIKSLN
jgi:hypothetical protein